MRNWTLAALALWAGLSGGVARAGDVVKKIIAEIDPVSPASAAYEANTDNVATSKWGVNVDFNLGGVISTGPELWVGNFTVKGPTDATKTYRREDFWPGEKQKLDAVRLRWSFTRWEQQQSMRGWYVKAGYSYTRINSRANRYIETTGEGDAVPVTIPGVTPTDETALVTDIRHGAMAGFGNRWLFADQSLVVTLGASFTANFKRTVTIDGKDPNAKADYDDLIATLPDTRMAVRPTPEVNMGVGYAW